MKLTNSEMAGIALFILFIVYLYYTHMNTTVHETQPVYKTQYIQVSRPRPRRYPRGRYPRHHNNIHPGKDWHIGPDGKYLPQSEGGVVPIEPLK